MKGYCYDLESATYLLILNSIDNHLSNPTTDHIHHFLDYQFMIDLLVI